MILTDAERAMLDRLEAAVQQEMVTMARRHDPVRLKWTVVSDASSSWLLITVDAAEPVDVQVRLPKEFAMWRETRDIYQVVDHAVLDDPAMREVVFDNGPVLANA